MSIEASSDLEELFRLNITFDISKGLVIETRNISDRARRVRQATVVTKWRNTTCLGQGACGVVWLQEEDEVPETCRAIKQIPKGTLSAPLPVDYRRELLALGRLSKREDLFVRFHGWYEDTRSVYLAMEYFEKGDLGQHLGAPLAEDEVRVISKQVLEGLAELHGQNWAHRDLKPSNIFVVDTSPWWVKIGDFGISKRIRSGNTRFQTMIGTRDFVAPEVLNLVSEVDDEDTGDDEDEYTVAVDMWSLGCVIFQLLTLETPFANRKKLGSYCRSQLERFPLIPLEQAAVSVAATEAIRGLLQPIPSHRTTADAALRCEWIQDVPGSSNNDYASQAPSRSYEVRRNSSAAADSRTLSEAQKAKQNAGKNQGSRSGPGKIEALNSITAKTLWREVEPQEAVKINSLEHNSNNFEGSGVLQTLIKPRATNSPSSYDTVFKINKEVDLKREALPSTTTFPSDVAEDRSSEYGNEIPSITSISSSPKARQSLTPSASSSPLSKSPSLHKGSSREVTSVSQVPRESSHAQSQRRGFMPMFKKRNSQQRAAKKPLKLTTSSDDASIHLMANAPLRSKAHKPKSNERSIDLPSTSVFSPNEQAEGPALVRGFQEMEMTEQRPKARNSVSIEHQTSFMVGTPRVPASDLDRPALRMAKQAERQKEAQEASEPFNLVSGLEEPHMVYGSGQLDQAQTGSKFRVPPVSLTNVPENGERKYQPPQSTGARKAVLLNHLKIQEEWKHSHLVKATADYLIDALHYRNEDVFRLTHQPGSITPRRADDLNRAMAWLFKNVKPGDWMFLQMSSESAHAVNSSDSYILRLSSAVTGFSYN